MSLNQTVSQLNSRPRLFEIESALSFYREKLQHHPIAEICAAGKLDRGLLDEFARIQYVDSTLWVTMLSLAKGRVTSPRLKRAIADNILCEVGHYDTPHVTMCQAFVRSLGLTAEFGDYRIYAPLTAHSVEIMNAFDLGTDGVIAGWLLVAESLVPVLFSIFRDALKIIPGADLRYLDEHITVDADEHAVWMREAAEEILDSQPTGARDLMVGIDLGARALLSVPDALFAKNVRLHGQYAV